MNDEVGWMILGMESSLAKRSGWVVAGTEEIRGGGLHWSNPTIEKAQATWPHQKPEVAFIAHRLLLDKSRKNEKSRFIDRTNYTKMNDSSNKQRGAFGYKCDNKDPRQLNAKIIKPIELGKIDYQIKYIYIYINWQTMIKTTSSEVGRREMQV